MPRQLSQSAFHQMFSQEQTDVFLMCLTLTHPDLPEPIRVVHNTRALQRDVGLFRPVFFEMSLPEDSPDQTPQVQLLIDNVNREIGRTISSLQGKLKVTLEVVLESQPNVVEVGPHTFWLLNASYNASQVQGTLGYEDDILNQQFPAQTYTPGMTPGVFR